MRNDGPRIVLRDILWNVIWNVNMLDWGSARKGEFQAVSPNENDFGWPLAALADESPGENLKRVTRHGPVPL